MNLSRIDPACNNVDSRPVLACGQETMNGPNPAGLAVPQVLRPIDVSDPRSIGIDLSQSLTPYRRLLTIVPRGLLLTG